jgi:hypothetical protein
MTVSILAAVRSPFAEADGVLDRKSVVERVSD